MVRSDHSIGFLYHFISKLIIPAHMMSIELTLKMVETLPTMQSRLCLALHMDITHYVFAKRFILTLKLFSRQKLRCCFFKKTFNILYARALDNCWITCFCVSLPGLVEKDCQYVRTLPPHSHQALSHRFMHKPSVATIHHM